MERAPKPETPNLFTPSDTQVDYFTTIAHHQRDVLLQGAEAQPVRQFSLKELKVFEASSGIPSPQGTTIRSRLADEGAETVLYDTEKMRFTVVSADGSVEMEDTFLDRDLSGDLRHMQNLAARFNEFKKINDPHFRDDKAHPHLEPEDEKILSRITLTTRHSMGLQDPAIGKALRDGTFDMNSLRSGTLGKDGIDYSTAIGLLTYHNQQLVHSIVYRFVRNQGNLDIESLMSVGQSGLLRAAQIYDGSLGLKFSTYATYWIRQAVSRYIKKELKNEGVENGLKTVSLDALVGFDDSGTLGEFQGGDDPAFERFENRETLLYVLDRVLQDVEVDSERKIVEYFLRCFQTGAEVGKGAEIVEATGLKRETAYRALNIVNAKMRRIFVASM